MFAPDLKWKRSTISDVIILQELENVREENKTVLKQVNNLKKEQSELISIVRQLKEEILNKKQDQNDTEKDTDVEPNQTNNGGKQRPQTRKANDWKGGKGGPKKPKNTEHSLRKVRNTLIPKTEPTLVVARSTERRGK